MRLLWWYLWIAPDIVLGICLFSLLRHGLRRRYLAFIIYIAFEVLYHLASLVSGLLIPYQLSSLFTYQWIVVFGLGISSLLSLGVFYGLANELLLSHSSLADVSRLALRWTAAILLLTAAIVSALLSKPDMPRVISVFQTLDFPANLIAIGLLLALLLFTSVLGISWRSLSTGIALGFGVSASAELAASAWFSKLGPSHYVALDLIRMAAFHVCVLIWLVYILLPEKPPEFTGQSLSASEMELWDQELQEIIRR